MYLIVGVAVLELLIYSEEAIGLSSMYGQGLLCVMLLLAGYMGWHSLLLNTTVHRVAYIIGTGLMLDHLTRHDAMYEMIFLSEGIVAKGIVAAAYAGIPTALLIMPVAVMMPTIARKVRDYLR